MAEIITQREWTRPELLKHGFQYYKRRKQLTLARLLPEAEAPMHIIFPLETVVVEAGYIICYDPGDEVRSELNDYDHWPVSRDIFRQTYRPWDEPSWEPTAQARHLMQFSCKPCYKFKGVWAKQLTQRALVQSMESSTSVVIPPGEWLAIGEEGEPWQINDDVFHTRYLT